MGFKINWASLIVMEVNLPFLLCVTLYLRAIFQVQAPQETYIWRGDLMEFFLCYEFGGLIFGRAYTWRDLFSEFYGIMIVFITILFMLKTNGICGGIT